MIPVPVEKPPMLAGLPTDLPDNRRDFIDYLRGLNGGVRDSELQRIRDHLEGGERARSELYFPKPSARMTDEAWALHRALITHVNLVRPAVRCWASAICGGDIVRNVNKAPEKDMVEAWVRSEDYTETVNEWVEMSVAYGTCAAVARYDDETQTPWTWTPDPLYTHIWTDPMDIRKVTCVAEVRPDQIMFVATWGEGYISDDTTVFTPRNFGDRIPAEIGYGTDRRRRGSVYGLSLVRDAVEWSIRCTAVAYNIALMQRQQTRSLLVRIGDLEELEAVRENVPSAGASDGASMDMPAGFQVDWKTPNPKLIESIEVLKTFVGLQATSESIPQDVVDASLTEKSGSAEAARIRALPLLQRTKQLVPVWIAREVRLIKAHAAMLEYIRSNESPIDWRSIDVQCDITITNRPNVLPTSPNEVTQDCIAKVAAHLMTQAAAIRTCDPNISEEDLNSLVAAWEEERDKKALAQEAAKAAANANALPEPSTVINGQAGEMPA